MKINRSYLMGLGTGLILSAVLTVIIPLQQLNPVVAGNSGKNTAGNSMEDTPLTGSLLAEIGQDNGKAQGNDAVASSTIPSVSGAQTVTPSSGIDSGPAAGATVSPNSTTSGTAGSPVPSVPAPGRQSFQVPAGASAERIAGDLVRQGLLVDKNQFLDAVVKKGVAGKFQAGMFDLSPGFGVDDLINKLIPK